MEIIISSHMQRFVRRSSALIIAGLCLTAFNVFGDADARTVEVSQEVIEDIRARQFQQARHKTFLAERALELRRELVRVIAKETHMRDMELAGKVTDALENYTSEFDVDPWVMVSLIRVESWGDPKAVSHVGAIGLTQIMPATGKYIARKLGVPWTGKEMLFDVDTNIRFGTYYLGYLLRMFDGELSTALAAYNWGPSHIRYRIANNKQLPRQYAGKIMGTLSPPPSWAVTAGS